jgi:hypothetical protein
VCINVRLLNRYIIRRYFHLNRAARSLFQATGLVLGEAGYNFQVRGCMKKVTITARAVSLIEEYAKRLEVEQGPGYVAVLEWQKGHRSHPHFVPQFALCFEKRDLVDPSRVMECDGKDVEIFQYAPDDMFGTDGQKFVDLRDNMLVIVDKDESAS